jgi:hypothetical protein
MTWSTDLFCNRYLELPIGPRTNVTVYLLEIYRPAHVRPRVPWARTGSGARSTEVLVERYRSGVDQSVTQLDGLVERKSW